MGSYVNGAITLSLILNCGQLAIQSKDKHPYTPIEDSTKYPFMAAIMEANYFLGNGAIVTDDIVLSAAHIVCGVKNIAIIAGGTSLPGVSDDQQIKQVSKIIKHDRYNCSVKRTHTYNVAVLVLKQRLALNQQVKTINLPNSISSLYYVNRKAIVAGWGRTSLSNEASKNLLSVELTILSDPECYDESVGVLKQNDDGFCAVDRINFGQGVCWGESGSVLFIPNRKSPNNYTLLGLASDVFAKPGRCQAHFPLPFASLLYLKKFVDTQIIENHSSGTVTIAPPVVQLCYC